MHRLDGQPKRKPQRKRYSGPIPLTCVLIPGTTDYYADVEGNIYTSRKLHFTKLKPTRDPYGYMYVELAEKDGKQKRKWMVHRLIAETFIQPVTAPFVNHRNHVRDDNRAANLEWVTNSENMLHMYAAGRGTHKGVNHYHSKFTVEDLRDIKAAFAAGETRRSLATKYSVSYLTIYNVIIGRTYKDVK